MVDDSDEVDITKIAREEAHRTVDHQVQTLNDIDSKVARILRINLVVLGIILTGISLTSGPVGAQENVIQYSDLINSFTISGLVFLLFSTGVAAITYTSSSLTAGVAPGDLQTFLDNDLNDRQNLEGLVEGYADWIQYNYKTNAKNAPLGTFTVLLLVYSMTALALGVKKAATGTIEPGLLPATIVLLLGITHYTGFWNQLTRYNRARKK